MATLAEDLLLFGLDNEKGTVSWDHSLALKYGLGGAILMDLLLQERVDIADRSITVRNPAPTGDAVLDAALERIHTASKAHDAKHWVKALGDGSDLKDQLARRLVAQGVLSAETHTYLRVLHRTRFPTSDSGPETSLRDHLRDVALSGATPEPRTLMLLSLIHACHLSDDLFSKDEQKEGRRRIKGLVEGEQFGSAVGKAIAETVAATAAVTASAFSVTVAPGASH